MTAPQSPAPSAQPAPVAGPIEGASSPRATPAISVPLMDPKRVYAEWGPGAEQLVVEILRSHAYVKGRHVRSLEGEFAAYVGVRHAVAVDSCTDALFLVLRAVFEDLPEERREVILPSFTFVATAGAVVNAGGKPVFADVDPETQNLDLDSLARCVTERTAAVLPVHLFGNPADIPAIRRVVRDAMPRSSGNGARTNGRPGVFVLEDAAQAIHGSLRGNRIGSLGDAATFSFYPSKNLGAAGDGGIVTTNSDRVADMVRALRDHGQTKKLYDHACVGTNSRMDEIQAAIVRVKLPLVKRWTRERRAIAARYNLAFQGTSARAQRVVNGARAVFHLYTLRMPERERVREALRAEGIDAGVYYPVPLHRQSCFARFEPSACPNADQLADEVLSLPCFPGLARDEQDRVIASVRRALGV